MKNNYYIMSNEKKSALASMLSQYESATTKGKEKTFDLKNYFTTYLPDGIDSAIKRVRILPTEDGKSPFVGVYVHSQTVDGKNRKFTCIDHENGEPCPFCEAREKLLATGSDSDKELAKNYRPRLMYVVKVIDRENEDHGPKFWRFPSNFKKEGIFDKIMANVRLLNEDVTDATIGRDLALNVERVKNPRGGTYPSVTSVMAPSVNPLSDNAEQAEAWMKHDKTWVDVYATKTYEYLEIIVKGGVPAWSKSKEKYVDKATMETGTSGNTSDELEAELQIGSGNTPKEEVKTEAVDNTYTAEVDKVDEPKNDDLPF